MARILIFDPNDPIVGGRVIFYDPSGHPQDFIGVTPNLLINPTITTQLLAVESRFWKVGLNNTISIMSSNEQGNFSSLKGDVNFSFSEKSIQESTTGSNLIYLQHPFSVEEDGDLYKIAFNLNIKNVTGNRQRYRYKVHIEDGGDITAPQNSGWVASWGNNDFNNNDNERWSPYSGDRTLSFDKGSYIATMRFGTVSGTNTTRMGSGDISVRKIN